MESIWYCQGDLGCQLAQRQSIYVSIYIIYICIMPLFPPPAIRCVYQTFSPINSQASWPNGPVPFPSRALNSLFNALSKNGTYIKSQLKSRYAKCVKGNWYSRHLCTSTAWQSSNLKTKFFPSHLFNMPLAPIRNKYNVSTN